VAGLGSRVLKEEHLPDPRGPSTEVDHIVSVAPGGDFYARDNLQAVCRPCHRSCPETTITDQVGTSDGTLAGTTTNFRPTDSAGCALSFQLRCPRTKALLASGQ
jgi:hypothetical protein